MSKPIESVVVVGGGAMGSGIALSFAKAGFTTSILSRDPSRLTDLPRGVSAVSEPSREPPDLAIEAVVEDIDVKNEVFARLEAAWGPTPILASNTSSLPLQDMADRLEHPERLIGVHYLHPAEALPIVEIIRVAQTADDVLERTSAALRRTGKHSLVVLNEPIVGFLINRLQHAILHEAYQMIDRGLCTAEDVDNVAKWGLGPRMCVTGLIEQKDISGLDIHARSQRGIVPELFLSREPARVCQDLFDAGHYGVKTGKGFYDWTGRDVPAFRKKAADRLARVLKVLHDD